MRLRLVVERIVLWLLVAILSAGCVLYIYRDQIVEALKPKIELELSKLVDSEVRINELKGAFWPDQGLVLDGIKISAATTCQHDVSIQRMKLLVDLRSLISRQIRIGALVAENIDIKVSRDQNGFSLGIKDEEESQDCRSSKNSRIKYETDVNKPKQGRPIVSLDIHEIALRNAAITIERETGKVVLLKNINLDSDLSFEQERFVLNNPSFSLSKGNQKFQLGAGQIDFDIETSALKVTKGQLMLDKDRLDFDVLLGAGSNFQELSVASKNLGLQALTQFTSNIELFKIPSLGKGSVNFTLKLRGAGEKSYQISGDAAVRDLIVPSINLKAGEIKLQKVEAALNSGSLDSIKTGIAISKFSIPDGTSMYTADSAGGSLGLVKKGDGQKLGGDLEVKDFSFADGTTKLSKSSAKLKNIDVQIAANGNVQAQVILSEGQTLLSNPNVEVIGAKNLSGPVTVIVKKGFYSVSGNASLQEATVKTLGKTFEKVSGDSTVFVSEAQKKFTSKNLSALVNGEKIVIASTFNMTPDGFSIPNGNIKAAGGTINANAYINRKTGLPFKAGIDASALITNSIVKILFDITEQVSSGVIDRFQVSGTGNFKDIAQSVKAKGSIAHTKKEKAGFDLSGKIAAAISQIPLVGVKLDPKNVKDESAKQISKALFTINDGMVNLTEISIRRDNYTVTGTAKMDFSGNIDGKLAVDFLQESISRFALGFERLGKLMGRVGRISIPLFIKGKIPDISLSPDIMTLTKDNSGITLLGDTVGTIGGIGNDIGRAITSPFRKKKKKDDAESSNESVDAPQP